MSTANHGNVEVEQLRWHRQLAESATTSPTGTRPELKLRHGEEVLWEAAGVTMVEVAGPVNLFAPTHAAFDPTLRSGAYGELHHSPESERDTGHVVVTTQRVFFDGATANREWAFAQLIGVVHGRHEPMTLMRVSNRQRLSGLVFEPTQALRFQFFLQLGLALHHHDRGGFVAHLANLEAQLAQPQLPVPARTGRRSPAVFLVPALVVAVVFLLCIIVAIVSPAQPKRPTSATGVLPAQTTASANPPAAVPTTAAPPTAVATSVAAIVTVPSPAKSTYKPPPPPPAPKVDLCGAPQNPWNYNFCSGGSTISSPPGTFCSYFNCIKSFWQSTNGYVMQCQDGMYSHSGGVSGSCSQHGGNLRPLKRF